MTRMSRSLLCGATVTLAFAGGRLLAQAPLPGQRVRVVLGGITGQTVVGYVEAFREDTLRLYVAEPSGAGDASAFAWQRVIALPVPAIESISVSERRRPGRGRNTLLGAALGVTYGAVVGLASGNNPRNAKGVFAVSAGEKAAYDAMCFGGLSTGVGAWLGHLSAGPGPDTWIPIVLPRGGPPHVVAVTGTQASPGIEGPAPQIP
jgi:hypothetical protein